jgi:type II secretory ATPase GspE/PulE/Tfp pilus assembly ATPase PilB-like protein
MTTTTDPEVELGAIGLVQSILEQAIDMKASDIHIDPERGKLNVRLRVDGVLYVLKGLEKYRITEEVCSKIKVMAEINITEKRLPQDGHLEFTYKEKTYNFRVSTTPTLYGESIVMRMLNKEGIIVNLKDLGLSDSQAEVVEEMISNPFGMILITGPTGSGKTTLLYSLLNKLNKPERNILTLEDPIEYQMNNVRQMQVNEAIGWDFAKAMRSVLRQDPDIIMLGEIRDEETAVMAFQAALSGRLVFSTFHTFDIPGMIIRLKEMGLPRSIIAHSINGVMAIRLVKTTCDKCKVEFVPSESELTKMGLVSAEHTFYKGAGCDNCKHSGYLGRSGIFEVVRFDEEIKENIMQDSPAIPLSKVLALKKFSSLRENGIELVKKGVTTPEEIIKVLGL